MPASRRSGDGHIETSDGERSSPRHLFVIGCPRSGTTAIARLLTSHHDVALGIERYGARYLREEFIDPKLYERDRFFTFLPGDRNLKPGATHDKDLGLHYDGLRDRYDAARYRGDKLPRLYQDLDRLLEVFGSDVRVIFIFRNIFDLADSYLRRVETATGEHAKARWRLEAAVSDWRDAIQAGLTHGSADTFLLVQYEQLFQAAGGLEALFDFLGLPVTDAVRLTYASLLRKSAELEQQRQRALGYADVAYITRHAPFDLYQRLLGMCAIALP